MTDEAQRTHDVDDAKLLNKVRAGDTSAFAILRRRHEQAARRLAGELTSSAGAADVLMSEAFDQVLSATQRGGGPTDAFRPYLLTALRQVSEGQAIIPVADTPGSGTPLMVQAFLSLPERWRAVLWHTEIEEMSPAEVAPLFGLSLTGVTAVRRSARDGLRQAYLQLHRARVSQPECEQAAARLGPFVRDAVPGSDSALVTGHLSECDDCRAAYTELADIGLTLRTVVAPAVLGAAAAAYLAAAATRPPHTRRHATGRRRFDGGRCRRGCRPGLDQAAGTAQSCDPPVALARGRCRRRDCGRRDRVRRDAQQP